MNADITTFKNEMIMKTSEIEMTNNLRYQCLKISTNYCLRITDTCPNCLFSELVNTSLMLGYQCLILG